MVDPPITPDQLNGIAALTRGDATRAERFRSNLARIARRSEDESFKRLVEQVLDGRASYRQVVSHPEFLAPATAAVHNLEAGINALPEEDRERVLARLRPDPERSVPEPTVSDAELDVALGRTPGRDESVGHRPPPAPQHDQGTW